MFRALWLTAILVMSLAFLPAAGLAEEQKGKASSNEATVSISSPAETEPASAPAPAAVPESPPIVPPALKPITITFSGDLTAVGAESTPATVTVQDRYGVKKEINVPAEAKITQGGAAKALSDLKAGDKLTVEYTYDVATGKRLAQSISVGEAAPAAQ